MRKIYYLILIALVAIGAQAQRVTDKTDRGLVAVPSRTSGNFVSWKVFGEEYYDVTYNLYANGTKIASNLKESNYNHSGGSATTQYQVAPVVRGVEQERCAAVTRWNDGYKQINLVEPVDREGNKAGSYYQVNDVSLGDLTGDGVTEFIVKRPCSDATDQSQKIRFNHLDCYDVNGKLLWWIDLGPNMIAGPDEQWDAVAYDWDEDGKAEVILRCEDGTVLHFADGTTLEVGDMNVDTRNRLASGSMSFTSAGAEYLLYLEGATGKPYQIGPSEHPYYMDYPLPRLEKSEFNQYIDWANQNNYKSQIEAYNEALETAWGDSYGHRSTKHYFGAPYLDGRHASIFLGRGCYTQHKFVALDVDKTTHKLTQRWYWYCSNSSSPWYGNGYHNFAVGDVDWDGRDEIIFGSMVIDDNGKGLSTTDYGHGDSQHCSDFDPYRKGQEQFACLEEGRANFGCNYRNATTSQIYMKVDAGGDDGRALMGNFSNAYPGSFGRSVSSGWIGSVSDKIIPGLDFMDWSDLNCRIYWDGDLLDEYMDSPGTAKAAVVYKAGTGARLVNCVGSLANDSKNNAGAVADIFGDWREELVLRYGSNALVIYTTNYPTEFRLPTLWSDHQYRNAMVWQSMGYNQPPHKSYFLGEMEDITVAPPPYTMTGRTEVTNGGTISTTDDHLIVCEYNNTHVNITNGASPYMVTFNVPSLVEGTAASNTTTKNTAINTTYYTCEVSGGALTGTTRVVKQGDGILTLPAVDMTYTGETNIWAGTVNFNGSAKNSPLWLNRFAELNTLADSTCFKSLKADYASVVRPGGNDKAGVISVDSIYEMGFGSRLVLDLYSDGLKADQVITPALKIEKKDWKYGPQYLMPVIEVTEHKAGGATTLEPGRYLIGHADSINGSLASIKVEGVTELKYGLEHDPDGDIYLVLGSVRGASEIVWTGSNSAVWDYATTENFYVFSDTEQTPDVFVKGDIVNFNDEANSFTVTLKDGEELPADTIRVNNTKAYTFNGTGAITSGALVKEGSGGLTIGNDNTYTGGNYLKGGTVRVSSLSSSTQAYGNLGGLTTTAAKFTMENGAVLQTTAATKMGSPIKMVGDNGGVINTGNNLTMEKPISGTKFTKTGSGTMEMQGNLSASVLVVSGGRLNYGANTYGKTVYLQNTGQIGGTGFISCPIDVAKNANATLVLTGSSYYAYNNKLTGTGTLTVVPSNSVNRVRITGDWSQFQGTIKHTTTSITLPLDNALGMPGATLDIAQGCTVNNVARSFRIGKLTGAGNLTYPNSNYQNQSSVSGNNTWIVGNDTLGDFTFNGKITDNGGSNKANFEKVGSCKMTVSGVWDNTGSVKISGGELFTRANACIGKGPLTVARDAILSGVGTLNNGSVAVNGILIPGLLATSPTGALDFGGKNLTMGTTGEIRVTARKCADQTPSASSNGCSTLMNINRMTCNGMVTVNISSSASFNVGDSIRIWSATSSTGSPKLNPETMRISDGLFWDDSRLSDGLLFVTDQTPEDYHLKGDVNEDGKVDINDVVAVINQMAGTATWRYANVNEDADGNVDINDVVAIINIMAGKS